MRTSSFSGLSDPAAQAPERSPGTIDVLISAAPVASCRLRRRKSRRFGSVVVAVTVWTVGAFVSCFISSPGQQKSNKNGAGFRTGIGRESDAVVLLVEPPLAQRSV